MKVDELWVLRTPGRHLIAETAAGNRSEVWSKSYIWIAGWDKEFARKYWKRWKQSRRWASRRGYRIVKARLVAWS
jgi:hypothetical protein